MLTGLKNSFKTWQIEKTIDKDLDKFSESDCLMLINDNLYIESIQWLVMTLYDIARTQ